MLTFNEASADPTMVDPNIYAYYFGRSFSDVSKLAWKKVCKEENNPTERKAQEETKISMRGRYAKIVKDSLRRY